MQLLDIGCPDLNSIGFSINNSNYDIISLNPALRSIVLYNQKKPRPNVSLCFIEQIASLQYLKHLSLHSFAIPNSIQWFIENTQLEELIVDEAVFSTQYLKIESNSIYYISLMSSNLKKIELNTPKLKALNINYSKIEEILLNCPKLETLMAKQSAFTNFELQHPNLRKCKFDQSRNLKSIAITSSLLRSVNLEHCHNLVNIELTSKLLSKLKTTGCHKISKFIITGCTTGLLTKNYAM